jgi:uncharacterized protein (DUF58 family)
MPRPRKRAAGLLGGAALLFVVGTSVQAGWLLVMSAALLGGAVAGWILPWRMTRGIELERRAPAEAFQGDDVRVAVLVTNASRRMRLALDLRDDHLEPTRAFVPRLAPGETVAIDTTRTARRRGVHDDAEVVLSSAAPFGVAEGRRRVAVAGSTIVYPRVVALDGLAFLAAAPTPERAMHATPRRGTGPEYLGIREYRVGDSMRHVHWPSTARHGELMVREFEREQTRRLAIVIDAVTDAASERGPTPLDVACSVAASVAFAADAAGQGVRLVGAAAGEPISLARAEPQTVLRWLAEVGPGAGMSVASLLGELGQEVLGVETVMVVAPTWRSNAGPELEDAVGDLARRAPRVVVGLVEVDRFEGLDRTPYLDPAEVGELARRLDARGALVLPVGAGEDLRQALGERVLA